MIAIKPKLVPVEIVAYTIKGKVDIPLMIKDLQRLPKRGYTIQTTRSECIQNTFLMVHETQVETGVYVLNYNSSGKLITYDHLYNWDRDAIFTLHPEE